jgi:2,6-dihydroxypseudooxynicotine hydrolase
MISDGIAYSDYEEAVRTAGAGGDWFEFWSAKGDRYESLGEEALAAGHRVSAGEWLWRASLSLHYAQFMWFHDPERREAGQRRKAELYARAAPHLLPPAERVEVSFDGVTIPGYLRLPLDFVREPPAPCVVLLGGLESTKEESYLFEDLCLRRGLATFAFDGPGQGELFFDVKLRPDFERYTSAVVDELAERPELDRGRLGVLGRSLGGYYAIRSAAYDRRFRACVAWGAFLDMSEFDAMPLHTQQGFAYVAGGRSFEAGRRKVQEALDLSDRAGELSCPLYVLHGVDDRIFSLSQIERLRREIRAPSEFVIEEDGDHCCHNMGQIVRPRMADWLAAQLS